MKSRYRRILLVYWNEVWIRLKALKIFLILLFTVLTVGTTSLMYILGLSFPRAVYESVRLLFFASDLPYPEGDVYLEILWMLFPLLGIMVIGDGLASIGRVLKYGDHKTEEWNREMAKLMKNHVILVGVGNVGLKVLRQIIEEKNEDVVVIDEQDESGRDEEFQSMEHDIPLIQRDATQEKTLEMAGVEHARTLLLMVDDDLVNLKIALLAKKMNPKLRVVARMFDLKFGEQVKEHLGVDEVISTSSIAAPRFVAAIDPIGKK